MSSVRTARSMARCGDWMRLGDLLIWGFGKIRDTGYGIRGRDTRYGIRGLDDLLIWEEREGSSYRRAQTDAAKTMSVKKAQSTFCANPGSILLALYQLDSEIRRHYDESRRCSDRSDEYPIIHREKRRDE